MKSLIRSVALCALFVSIAALASCGGRLPHRLALDSNPVFTDGIGWIVVTQAYARVKEQPSDTAQDVGHLRGGDTLAVLGRDRKSADTGLWYKVSADGKSGWIAGPQAVFFETREMAETAAAQYR